MIIALMRHGQTDWNLEGRVQGRTDIPLNDTGRRQIRDVAQAIRANADVWDVVTSSPLSRARESARIAAEILGIPLTDPHDGLIEQHYGEAEGVAVAELHRRWPDRNFAGGETPEELQERVLRTINDLAERHGSAPLLAVTHGAYIRRLIATLMNEEYTKVPRIRNASISTVEYASGSWVVRSVNEHPAEDIATPQSAFTMMNSGDALGACTIDGVCS